MSFKLLLRTISTGIVLGLITIAIWAVSFRLPLSPPRRQAVNDKDNAAVIKPQKTISQSQNNFGQQVQAFILPVSQANYLPIRNFNIPDPDIAAKAAGLFDLKSEKLLYSKSIDQRLPIASVTKLMTAVVIMENMSLADTYTVSAEDINADGNGGDFTKGEQIKGSDLLKIMLINSSNDAALVFAGNAAKNGMNLVTKMNEKAASLRMTNSKFSDPTGLNDGDSFSTVADLIKLVQYIGKYPIIWEILSTRTADISSIDGKFNHYLINTNQLLNEIPEIIGGKTGFTDGALGTMVLEVKIDELDNKMVALVLGSNDRFGEIKKLVEWGKQAYSWQ